MERVILIRFGEIFLKGKNRGYFEKSLFLNIKTSLEKFNLEVVKISGRYIVKNYNLDDENEIVSKISKIPGIFSFSIADLIRTSIENIENHSVELMKDEKGTFKVETNRADKKLELNSMQISAKIGGKILASNRNLKVDIKNP
ncbi:MAG: tRNA 4-thiouridine(8) synthase ThiI, partial [Clostridia bacterium]|nr:tRNA 4-thiouridine(8) synthase ThiI [Clostridia bacterium]